MQISIESELELAIAAKVNPAKLAKMVCVQPEHYLAFIEQCLKPFAHMTTDFEPGQLYWDGEWNT